MSNDQLWLSVGLVGQAFFSMRFVVQWIISEKRQESVIPLSFWFFSIGGGLTLFTYALHRLDPVFILGEGAGIFVYSRNLYLYLAQATSSHSGLTLTRTPWVGQRPLPSVGLGDLSLRRPKPVGELQRRDQDRARCGGSFSERDDARNR